MSDDTLSDILPDDSGEDDDMEMALEQMVAQQDELEKENETLSHIAQDLRVALEALGDKHRLLKKKYRQACGKSSNSGKAVSQNLE